MSYQVLARKFRPRNFHELVGQSFVVRALTNALDQGRLHHAFLLTGTRGVGKTTIARIFAKSLNCDVRVSSTPCGECAACRDIDAGRFVDLIEVDAASRTKVEDTRELLENVQYAPSRGRFKVYLIDEVHMLSTHSFNALLKTLEEPPPHVKFILATTDPQKLPATILSRCLQFHLKRLPAPLIAEYLCTVLTQEAVPYETAAVDLIARAGDGSMRDALSLLDQAIAFGNGQIEQATVRDMLGSIDRQDVVPLIDALAANDAAALLHHVAHLDASAPDYAAVLAEILSLLQRVAWAQKLPEVIANEEPAAVEAITQWAQQLPPEEVQLWYQIALIGRRDLPLMPEARSGFEMVLLRMLCFRPATSETVAATIPTAVQRPPVHATTAPAVTTAAPVRATTAATGWQQLIIDIGLTGATKQAAIRMALFERTENLIHLLLHETHAALASPAIEARIKEALEKHFGRPMRLQITQTAEAIDTPDALQKVQQDQQHTEMDRAIAQDPHVQMMEQQFGARILEKKPRDEEDQ